MRTQKRNQRSNGLWAMFLAASASTTAALAVATGAVAAYGHASPHHHAYKGLYRLREARSARARLVHGLLLVEGTSADDKIGLRLKAGDPNTAN